MENKKILIIRFSSIGDIVLTSPVVRCVKKQIPGATIHMLTKSVYAPMLEANPHIDKIYSFHKGLHEVIPKLRKEHYDLIIDLHKNLRSLRVRIALWKKTYSFQKLNFRKLWYTVTKQNVMPDKHIVDRYLDSVKPLGIINDGQGLDFFVADEERVCSLAFPSSFQKGYVALVIGSKHATKQMPVNFLIRLCKQIHHPIILIGGDSDREKAMQIENAVGTTVFNTCGAYTIGKSASIIEGALGVITPDTGMMHIAAAYRKNIISVWGNTVPAFGMYPYFPTDYKGHSIIMENNDLACRPCSKLGYKHCPKKHFKCMNDLSTNEIATLANRWGRE